ncbi:MAG: tRNA (adenosine(37)-N6)-threonylcarbamoyltransferase complex transferase subunit TsaD [Bacteroidales bacterium]|nr:tRNA (adenosine(37)-N6)-threonylcarbamoyltransferase complex transferase subunit TsaD [Bacteroidales bacterium]
MSIYILGIESSCDDTSASVIKDTKVLSNIIANQEVHREFGGVVPELASRAHQQNIIPVIDKALSAAKINKKQLNAVAFTLGPGLLGSLLVGTSFAKAFSLGLNIPMIEVNHLQAHILSHFIRDNKDKKVPIFPFLCLVVSGGHTQIVLLKDYFEMEIIGRTIDDAAGEAFDKSAKILGLPYPGGPLIDKYAELGNKNAFTFPEPKIPNLDFSFSGLKTSFLYFIRDRLKENPNFIDNNLYDLCASIQKTIVRVLIKKLIKASEKTGIKEIAIAGGVSANSELRNELIKAQKLKNWTIFIPKIEYSTDNAAMIAIAGYYKYLRKEFSNQGVSPFARDIVFNMRKKKIIDKKEIENNK